MTKNPKINKLICWVILAAMLAGTIAGLWLGIAGRDTQMVSVLENGEWTDRALYRQISFIPNTFNATWKEAFTPSVALGGGYSYNLTAARAEGASDADFQKQVKQTAKILKERAEMITGSVNVKMDGDQITLLTASSQYDETLAQLLTAKGEVAFCLLDEATGTYTEPFLTGADIKDAGYYVNNGVYYLSILFDKAGGKEFAEITAATAGGYMYILVDGAAVAAPYISGEIKDGGTSIQMESQGQALYYAVLMRSGALPIAVTMGDTAPAEATLGSLVTIAILLCAALVLAAIVWFIIRGKLMGVLSAWALVVQLVFFFLFSAVTALTGGMVISVFFLAVMVVCVLSAIFGVEVLSGHIAAALRKGRGMRAAAGDAFGKSFKLLGIVYGAMLGAGVLLMFIFQARSFGLLGRFIAISALSSFASIFVFLRLALSCCFVTLGDDARLYGASK